MSRKYLLCYDISDDARLRRVASIAERYGVRLQYSVFLVQATTSQLQALVSALEQAIDPRQDDVRLYPLPSAPSWEHHGAPLWPSGIFVDGEWPADMTAEDEPEDDAEETK